MMKGGINIQKSKASEREHSSRLNWGDWSQDTVRLDFDHTPLDLVKYWAYRALRWFHLEGFIILESSRKDRVIKLHSKPFTFKNRSYHVVFNRPVNWDLNVRVMNWVALQAKDENLTRFVQMQGIKRSSTLFSKRCGRKTSPRVVFRYGAQDKQVKEFLETRKFVLDALNGKEVN